MMATKKLSDNSLDLVSGGDCYETADDSRFLNVLLQGRPGHCDRYGEWRIFWQYHDEEIRNAWAVAGVAAWLHDNTEVPNSYMVNGKWVTQEEARQHAMEVIGKHLTVDQWDW